LSGIRPESQSVANGKRMVNIPPVARRMMRPHCECCGRGCRCVVLASYHRTRSRRGRGTQPSDLRCRSGDTQTGPHTSTAGSFDIAT
jgi:hypothetical protein